MAESCYKIELWEGIKVIYDRFEEGRRTLQDLRDFLSKRQSYEDHYCKDMTKLCSKPSTANEGRTLGEAWNKVRSTQDSLVKARHIFSQALLVDTIVEVDNFLRESLKQKTTLALNVTNLVEEMSKMKKHLSKCQADFHSKSDQWESALSAHEKAANDPLVPSKQLAKLKSVVAKARKAADAADEVYKTAVRDVQLLQASYEDKMKEILNEFQIMDESRISFIQISLQKVLQMENRFHDEAKNQIQIATLIVEQVNNKKDVIAFIDANRTNQVPDKPAEYVPYRPKNVNTPVIDNAISQQKKTSTAALTSSRGSNAPAVVREAPPAKTAKALYEYTAADNTEISFQVDDIVTVLRVDESGWWEGEIQGKRGLFPGNHVELIESSKTGTRKCRAAYDFKAEEVGELSIIEGEIITVLEETEGWYMGMNARGQKGLFPANFVELL